MIDHPTALFCHSCGATLVPSARFCSQCGINIGSSIKSPSAKNILGGALCGIILCTFIWFLGQTLIGKKPANQHVSLNAPNSEPHIGAGTDRTGQSYPEILRLQEAVTKAPTDPGPLKTLTRTLWNKIVDIPNPPPAMILDLVDALGTLLKLEPQNGEALLMMANLSFNQKVFDKSSDYFARYLEVKGEDYEARASYASTLTFLGRHEEALKEIDKVLDTHPNYFQAIAYKAITFAQMGKKSEAVALGQKALSLSPNEEAKARFAGFIDSLQKSPEIEDAASVSGEDKATTFVRSHPIAAPKFVNGTLSPDGIVTIVLKDFPMEHMPPSVKESFLAKLKAASSGDQRIKKVRLVDAGSGAELASVMSE